MSSPVYRPGDLIRAGSDGFYAEVRRTARDGLVRGRLEVRLLAGTRGRLEVLTRDVTAHWRRVR